MKVCSISFQGVYRTNQQFSPVQYKISENIIRTLTSQEFADKNGITPDKKYKDKGFDTILSPNGKDKVDVNIVTDFHIGIGIQPHTYKEKIFVGTYNNRSLFSENDIKNAINDKNFFGYAFLAPAVAFLALLAGSALKKCSVENKQKQVIENVAKTGSIKNIIKPFSDTVIKLIKNR